MRDILVIACRFDVWGAGEWAFGGATRHVLAHAGIPLFMRH